MTRRTSGGWAGVAALGLLTIASYGSWFYAFGVLIDPIAADTGWSTSALGFTYGLAQVLTGLGAFGGGRLLDRFDAAGPFRLQAVIGGGLLLASSFAGSIWAFGAMYAVAGGVIGGTGFYSVTTAAVARLHPDGPDRATARLTIFGAFSSPIYLPGTAWLVTNTDWRVTIRVLAVITITTALLAAIFARGSASGGVPSANPLVAMRRALALANVRRMLLVYFLAGVSFAAVLVYQVPVMTAAGLTLATAGTIGGFRGFCQVFGRIGLMRLVDRFGVQRLLLAAYAFTAIGIALLAVGTVPAGIAYALIAGAAIGASSPLQAMYAREAFDESDLGLLMGLQGAVLGLAGGAGAFFGGVMFDATGSWAPIVAISVMGSILAAFLLRVPGKSVTRVRSR